MKLRKTLLLLILVCITLTGCVDSPAVDTTESYNASYADIPTAYQDILVRCSEILDNTEDGYYELSDSLGSLYWFADRALHAGEGETFCYSLIDMNHDGIEELVLACKGPKLSGIDSSAGYSVFNIYTLDSDEAVLLAESSLQNRWYMNADGLLINERTSNPAICEIGVYSFEENSSEFTEKYHIYNTYLDESRSVGLFESVDGEEEVLLGIYDGSAEVEMWWEKFESVRAKYIQDLYLLELVPIVSEEEE